MIIRNLDERFKGIEKCHEKVCLPWVDVCGHDESDEWIHDESRDKSRLFFS